jgi:hypothetical protein
MDNIKMYFIKRGNARVTLRRVCETIVAVENNSYFIFSVCVCTRACVGALAHGRVHVCARVYLLIQHATRRRQIVFSFVASAAPPYFSKLSTKLHDFGKKKLLNIKCVFRFSLQLLSKTFLIFLSSTELVDSTSLLRIPDVPEEAQESTEIIKNTCTHDLTQGIYRYKLDPLLVELTENT